MTATPPPPSRHYERVIALGDDGKRHKMNVVKSPFFRPSDPRQLRRMSTPGGTVHQRAKVEDEAEHKSTILGASANMIVSIVGAGIVGIPFALRESGLVAGVFMVLFCALITEKSLRLLIETAKHIDVPSYETLYEASFGTKGFFAMSIIMFSMSYGAMVSYMMIMKDTMSYLLGIDDNDQYSRRAILATVTLLVLFPLSAQRDMADLAKTSRLSVVFYLLIVLFVVFNSPVRESVQANGGWKVTVGSDILRPATFFTGLGVLSFAYVCQHSAFIIAGSLKHPTKQRWAMVTGNALLFSGTLATLCGVFGYLGFLGETDGNVLNNFETLGDPLIGKLANAARGMLLMCMFFVYPMDAFVSRHVCVVLLFKGRSAHEGDDHAVLQRRDRRIILTFALIVITLLPALLLNNLGVVLAITGAIAGSFLSYIGPGTSYLAVHGEEFVRISQRGWTWGDRLDGTEAADEEAVSERRNPIKTAIGTFFWFLFLMPIWVLIARVGQQNLEQHFEKEALKSPHPSRLGNVVHRNQQRIGPKKISTKGLVAPQKSTNHQDAPLLTRTNSEPRTTETSNVAFAASRDTSSKPVMGYGSVGGNRGVEDALAASRKQDDDNTEEPEDDPQEAFPKLYDFIVAIGFIVFGMVAMFVGLLSIYIDA